MPLALNCDVLLTDMFSYTEGCGWLVMNFQLHKTSPIFKNSHFKS